MSEVVDKPAPLVTLDGIIFEIDSESGEVIEVRHPDPAFVADTRERVDWVMGKMLAIDSEIAAIENSHEVNQAKAILEHAETRKKKLLRQRAGLDWKFSADLEKFAMDELCSGGKPWRKGKSWTGTFGTISFRSEPARLKVSDESAAAKWASLRCPESLRVTFDLKTVDEDKRLSIIADSIGDPSVTRKVMPSWVPADVDSELLSDPILAEASGFAITPAHESVTIKTLAIKSKVSA